MSRRSVGFVIPLALVGLFATSTALTQNPATRIADQINRQPNVLTERISSESISRQTEILRLESKINRLETRIVRLERQQLASSRLPLISVEEAEATLKLAEATLEESTHQAKKGRATGSQVAADELALVRARAQLKLARSGSIESRSLLQLDVTFAKRRLLEATGEMKLRKRLVARGYARSEELQQRLLDVDQAKQELVIAETRLSAASDDAYPTQ